jgi:hypothetical protein
MERTRHEYGRRCAGRGDERIVEVGTYDGVCGWWIRRKWRMEAHLQQRDATLEERERRRFLVLSRILTLCEGDVGTVMLCSRIADDLGLGRSEAANLFSDLIEAGYLADAGAGPAVSITPQGVLYVEHRAGRRRSVRMCRSAQHVDSGVVAALLRIMSNGARAS